MAYAGGSARACATHAALSVCQSVMSTTPTVGALGATGAGGPTGPTRSSRSSYGGMAAAMARPARMTQRSCWLRLSSSLSDRARKSTKSAGAPTAIAPWPAGAAHYSRPQGLGQENVRLKRAAAGGVCMLGWLQPQPGR